MAIPTGATRVRLKIAPQRGQMLALAEIMPPHAGHEVILFMTLPRFSRNRPSLRAARPSNKQAWLMCGPGESYSGVIIRVARVSCSNPGAFIPVEWS
jgi:hypothetical protein